MSYSNKYYSVNQNLDILDPFYNLYCHCNFLNMKISDSFKLICLLMLMDSWSTEVVWTMNT
jgi:hypothetical protein